MGKRLTIVATNLEDQKREGRKAFAKAISPYVHEDSPYRKQVDEILKEEHE